MTRRNFWQSLKQLLLTFRATVNLPCFSELQAPKAVFKSVLASNTVAKVTYCVTKMITTCSPTVGYVFDTMIAASIDKEWL